MSSVEKILVEQIKSEQENAESEKKEKEMALWKGAIRAYHDVKDDKRFQHHLSIIVKYLLNFTEGWNEDLEDKKIRLILWLRQFLGESAEAYEKEEKNEKKKSARLAKGEYNSCFYGISEHIITAFQGMRQIWDKEYLRPRPNLLIMKKILPS